MYRCIHPFIPYLFALKKVKPVGVDFRKGFKVNHLPDAGKIPVENDVLPNGHMGRIPPVLFLKPQALKLCVHFALQAEKLVQFSIQPQPQDSKAPPAGKIAEFRHPETEAACPAANFFQLPVDACRLFFIDVVQEFQCQMEIIDILPPPGRRHAPQLRLHSGNPVFQFPAEINTYKRSHKNLPSSDNV